MSFCQRVVSDLAVCGPNKTKTLFVKSLIAESKQTIVFTPNALKASRTLNLFGCNVVDCSLQ